MKDARPPFLLALIGLVVVGILALKVVFAVFGVLFQLLLLPIKLAFALLLAVLVPVAFLPSSPAAAPASSPASPPRRWRWRVRSPVATIETCS